MGLVTFHKILRGCEDGIRESWRLFLTDYSPIVFHLAAVYLPNPAGLGKQVWRDVLQALTSNDFERLRNLDHQAEREFLLDLRALFLDCGVTKLDPSRDFAQAQPPALDRVRELLKDLPLLHQQVMFTKLAGYSEATIIALRIAASCWLFPEALPRKRSFIFTKTHLGLSRIFFTTHSV